MKLTEKAAYRSQRREATRLRVKNIDAILTRDFAPLHNIDEGTG